MIQRIQTVFWALTLIFIGLFLNQLFDVEMGLKIFQEPRFSIFSTIAILLNFFSIFSFKRRRRQITVSTVALILLLVQVGMLIYAQKHQMLEKYILPFVFLLLGVVSNILANYFTKQDIKLLESSSRLR